MQAEIEELTYVLVISGLFPFLACFLQLPKSVTKPAVKVVKAAKAAPAKKILAPTKSSDDDDDDGESSDEVRHNTHLQYFAFASATGFVDWNPSY
jgi:hypothetical protein